MSYQYVKDYRNRLKERIIYVMGGQCQCCGYRRCQQALELHHLNPEEKDFTFSANANRSWENVRPELKKCILVCANCHREIHNKIIDNQILFSSFSEEKAKEIDEIIEDFHTKHIEYCKQCGTPISDKRANCCSKCAALLRRTTDRPNRKELKQLIRTLPFTQIGKQYNVTDNSIRKWCKTEKLPSTKAEINKYSDEEWEKI